MVEKTLNIEHRCPPTIFCDIDGTIWEHVVDPAECMNEYPTLLPGARERFLEWHRRGFKIILTTGRPEFLRSITIETLQYHGIFFDQLVMGCGPGPRVLVNDTEEMTHPKACAINVDRNMGLLGVHIDYTQKVD